VMRDPRFVMRDASSRPRFFQQREDAAVNAAETVVIGSRGDDAGVEGVKEGDNILDEHVSLAVILEKFYLEEFLQPEEEFGIDAAGRFVFQAPELVLRDLKSPQPQFAGELIKGPAFALAGLAEPPAQLVAADLRVWSAHGSSLGKVSFFNGSNALEEGES